MGRKVCADIEFQRNDDKLSRSYYFPNVSLKSDFYPCDAISCNYEYPLKIMLPSPKTNCCCQWLYPIVFGGGLVEGDDLRITMKIGIKCCILVTSLSFPKVYYCENQIESQQHWSCNIESGALLCVLPDPLVCYKDASFLQTQAYYLTSDANLVLLDWFTSGRYERGERWSFYKLHSTSSVFVNGEMLFREAQYMKNSPLIELKSSMKTYNILGTCMIVGPALNGLSDLVLQELGKCKAYGEKVEKHSLFSASPLYLKETKQYGCIIRFAAETVSMAVEKMEKLLHPLWEVLGENPFKSK